MKKIIFTILLLYTFAANSQYGWLEDTSGVNVRLNSVISSNNAAWICGNSGTVLRTRNMWWGPTKWKNVTGNGIPTNINLTHISFWANGGDSTFALTTGVLNNSAYVYRTTNAGLNWSQVFTQQNGNINGIYFSSDQNAIMVGNPVSGRWSIWKTSNRGSTWDSSGMYLPQAANEQGWINSIFGIWTNRLWFGTNNSRIYYSTNYGLNWMAQSTLPEINSNTVNFKSENEGLTGGATLMKSTNAGLNWLSNPSVGTGNFSGFAGVFSQWWWYVRSDNKIYISSNYGTNWSIQHTAPAGNYTHMFRSYAYVIFAIRDNGGISRYHIMVGIKKVSSQVPEIFSLHPNYPNPFNPVTKIKFEIPNPHLNFPPKEGNVRLDIYNSLGQKIETLVNENLRAGTYEAEFDGSDYPSGVYFYQLNYLDASASLPPAERAGSTSYSETKKMVLIK